MCKLTMESYRWTIPRVIEELVLLGEGIMGADVEITTPS